MQDSISGDGDVLALQRQYEAFPYPPRDVAAEAGGLSTGSPSHILEIDHYVFAGRRDWSRPFRALVAGGGTGDAAIMLGQQCADIGCPADITYLDLSASSMAIAERRARERGLTNIAFRQGSLLDIATHRWPPFDYIDCCGVLHHLSRPEDGLRALASVLHPEGGIGIMLYGRYGRTGVYDIQEIMRGILRPGEDQALQIPALRALLAQLPGSNRLVRNPVIRHDGDQPDAELVDIFLHRQDRAYTVPEIAALCDSAGMRIESFVPSGRYDPSTFIADESLRQRFAALSSTEKAAAAELIGGNIAKHVFYALPAAAPARRSTLSATAIPVLKHRTGAALAAKITPESAFQARFNDLTVLAAAPPLTAEILRRIDNSASLEDIYFDLTLGRPGIDWHGFISQFQVLYGALHGLLNAMFLRHDPQGSPAVSRKPKP
ncbi:MAG: class I SAM-dependent methyltransferase [Alphaproteobacteria bacterium]